MIITVTASSSLARADWREFIPRPYENHLDLGVFFSYESESNKSSGVGQSWNDTFIKETLTLTSNGFIYHPRFIWYALSLSGALKEENYEAASGAINGKTGWTFKNGTEYDVEIFVLPEHPYNLRLFTRRFEPLYMQQSSTQTNNVATSNGAILTYKRKPYFLDLKYVADTNASSSVTSDVNTFSTSALYYKVYPNNNLFEVSGTYTHQNFTSSQQLEGNANIYSFSSDIRLYKANLYSSLSKNTFDQTSGISGSLKNDQLTWDERLTADLPLDFSGSLYYNYQKNTAVSTSTAVSPETTLSNTIKQVNADLVQKIYKSLLNTYSVRHILSQSPTGDTAETDISLASNYTKIIPGGLLLAGLNLGRSITDSSGQTSVVNELHSSISVPPGVIIINAQNVNPATVSVFLKSPLPPFELVALTENIDYTITMIGNKVQINIINLPAQFVIPGTFDFLISYQLSAGNFKLQQDTFGYNISLNLFNNMVNPYFSYIRIKSRVLSGEFTGIPPDSNSYTAGISLQKGPYRLLAEYQIYNANIAPYKQWRAEASYNKNITETTQVNALASYISTNYPQGSSFVAGQGFTNQTFTLTASIRKEIPRADLYMNGGGSYSLLRGTTNGSSYTLNGNLNWKIGKVTMTLGANAYWYSAQSGTGGTSIKAERDHQYYFLNMTRNLF